MYHTFAFVLPGNCTPHKGLKEAASAPIALRGRVTTFGGQPKGNQLVVITLANGNVRRIYTNRKGEYVLYSAPEGGARLVSGNIVASATIMHGQTTTANLTAQ